MSASPCPDPNALAAYASHGLAQDARASVEVHLDGCSSCLAIVAELARVDRPLDHPSPAAGEPENKRFGKYRLESIVGEGAMGTVYAARDEALDRRVALKILRRHADEAGARARLTRESRAMARLSHPNVVTVYDAGEFDGLLYIAMELFEGATLGAWLRSGARPWKDALAILLRAGSGLVAAHAAGLVHRDFKPENVLLGTAKGDERRARVVVTDFGLVAAPENEPVAEERPSAPAADLALTRTGIVVGTPRYMSPEQFAGATVDARSDQFSFAVTLYEALYGVRPFAGRTLHELRRATTSGDVMPPPAETEVPPAIHRALLRALASDPDQRFPALADLLRELRPFAPGASEAEHVAPAAPRPPRTHHRAVAVTALAAVTALTLAFLVRHARVSAAAAAKGSSDGGQSGVLAAPDGRRTIVVVAPFANQTGEPRIDGVSEELLASGLDCSLQLDAYAPADLPWLGQELGAADEESPDAIVARALDEGRRVVLVRGSVSASSDGGGSLGLVVESVDAAHGTSLARLEGRAGDVSALSDAVAKVGEGLRRALGVDARPEGAAPRAFSSSLDALAAWTEAHRKAGARAWPEVIEAGQRAVAADPAFALAQADYAYSLAHESRDPEATDAYAAALSCPRGSLCQEISAAATMCQRQRLKGLAMYYSEQQRYTAAAHLLEHDLSEWPGDVLIETLMANMLLKDRDWPVGLAVARSAVREHPRALIAHSFYLSVLFMAGDNAGVGEEGELLETMTSRPPEHALSCVVAADALLGREDAARAVLRRQAAYNPEMSDQEEADLDLFQGRLDDAEAILRRQVAALTAQDDVTYARSENIIMSGLYLRRGDLASAREAAKAAMIGASDEANESMLYELGRVFLSSHAEQEVEEVARLLAALSTPRARLLGALFQGDRHRMHHQLDDAVARYADALRLDDAWFAHERIGELALETGDFAGAERELALCLARRAEGVTYLEPGLHFLSEPYLDLARAKDGAKKADAAAAYRAFLANEPAPQNDPLADFARRRLKVLEGSTTPP